MMHYDAYADVPEGAIDALLRRITIARLVTTDTSVTPPVPHLGLYPFTTSDRVFELHLHRQDEQIRHLRQAPVCLLEVDEPLAAIPSHWIDPEDGSYASLFHRTVSFVCAATLVEDAASLAAQQSRLLARYQPEGGYRPIDAEDPLYAGMLRVLVGVRLTVREVRVKFKLGQNRDLTTRQDVIARLRARGEPLDAATADALQETVDLGWTMSGRSRA